MPASESATPLPNKNAITCPPSPTVGQRQKVKASLTAPQSSALSEKQQRNKKELWVPPTQSDPECFRSFSTAVDLALVKIVLEGYAGMTREWWSFSCPKMRAQFVRNEKVKPEVNCCYLKADFCYLIISLHLFVFVVALNCKALLYKL